MAWKLKILLNLGFNCFSMMNTDYLSFLHERVPKYLHFIFWSQFWNINHEHVMDTFCHFSSLTWPIYCGFLLILYQISSLNWCIIGHVMQVLRFSIIRVLVYCSPLVSIMHSCYKNFKWHINPWLLVGLSCVIHHWKGLFRIRLRWIKFPVWIWNRNLCICHWQIQFLVIIILLILATADFRSARHLLRNYKSYSSAIWHQHSPISDDVHTSLFVTPRYLRPCLPPEAAKGFRSSIHFTKTAWRTCMYDGSYRRYW